jgi:hypothetical protein
MTRTVWPYIRPSHGIETGAWQIRVPDGVEPLPRELPYWDYNTDLRLTRTVVFDTVGILTQCGLADDAVFRVAAIWRSTGSGLRTLADLHIIGRDPSGPVPIELDVALKGTDVGGVVTLSTQLLIETPGSTLDPTAPRRPGSVLWSDESSVRLQGDAARFPMDLVDFRNEVFPDQAGWHLKIGRELHAAAMGSILLLINSENAALAQAVARAANPRHVDRIVLSALYADVTRSMIEHALVQPEFNDQADYVDESLGEVLRNLCRRIFPGVAIAELRQRRENSPNLFATDIQGAIRIFEDAT